MIIETLKVKNGNIKVVRDDLLNGGTKSRAAVPFLKYMSRLDPVTNLFLGNSINEFVYASPFCGYAQVALALSAAECGFKSTIFVEKDPYTSKISELSQTIINHSNIILCDSLTEAEVLAENYSKTFNKKVFKIPLGFNDPAFRWFLKDNLRNDIKKLNTKRFWLPVGSGTLASIFREILPKKVKLACINVRVLPDTDSRLEYVKSISDLYISTPEKFHEPRLIAPPIPSNKFYDSKLWQHIYEFANNGDVWWNVAA